jgi:hypothetical protein
MVRTHFLQARIPWANHADAAGRLVDVWLGEGRAPFVRVVNERRGRIATFHASLKTWCALHFCALVFFLHSYQFQVEFGVQIIFLIHYL